MADYRILEIKVSYARHLKNVHVLSKMDPYVVVSISCDPNTKRKTPVDRTGNKNPTWNSTLKFEVDVGNARYMHPMLVFSIRSECALGDKTIGDVHVPLTDLLSSIEGGKTCHVAYQVRKPSGKAKGQLNFSYQWGEKLAKSPPSTPPLSLPIPRKSYPLICRTNGRKDFFSTNGILEKTGMACLLRQIVPILGFRSYGPCYHPPRGGHEHRYSKVTPYLINLPPHHYVGYLPPLAIGYGCQGQSSYTYRPVLPPPKKKNSNGLLGIKAKLLDVILQRRSNVGIAQDCRHPSNFENPARYSIF